MKIYNGEGIILGRLASEAAKTALSGEEVRVVNCNKIIVSGKKTNTFQMAKARRDRKGYPLKSAKHSRLPERYVRRSIRGMLPWKFARGREAFKRVMCYRGLPEEFAAQQLISLEQSSAKKLPTLKYITVREICKAIGWNEKL
ncbi:MAG TPA: 50S ribosomal protein L13 [Candidatus Nanoarchaeia archaeon]|nr:50S ribosomal protein L13 [Candidatus Nanoarchaeia archaeon]